VVVVVVVFVVGEVEDEEDADVDEKVDDDEEEVEAEGDLLAGDFFAIGGSCCFCTRRLYLLVLVLASPLPL